MSAIRVPGPDGLIRLIDQGPAVGRITHSLKAARGSSVAATVVYGALVVGRSGDAHAAAHADYGPTSALGEVALMAAHLEPVIQARPCSCGGTVIADRRDPTEGVRLHQAEARHMDWQAVQEARRPTKRPCPCHGDES